MEFVIYNSNNMQLLQNDATRIHTRQQLTLPVSQGSLLFWDSGPSFNVCVCVCVCVCGGSLTSVSDSPDTNCVSYNSPPF